MKPLIALLFCSCLFVSCHHAFFKEKWLKEKAPATFSAIFETSKGNFEAEFERASSPLAVDRLFVQLKHGYYNHTLFYRVRPRFVVQFGVDDSLKMNTWKKYKVPDEPVLQSNLRGAISFAREGKDSRGNDLFINLADNKRLDTITFGNVKGFPAFGKVTKGMDVVESLYGGYSDSVFSKYDLMIHDRKAFEKYFPLLDSIKRVTLVTHK